MKEATIHFYCLLDESRFSGTCTIAGLKELNWLCKHKKNVRSSQPCVSMKFYTESSCSMWVSLRDIEDVCASSQSGTLRKKIICTKKTYESDSVASTWNMGTSIINFQQEWVLWFAKKYLKLFFLFNMLSTSLMNLTSWTLIK